MKHYYAKIDPNYPMIATQWSPDLPILEPVHKIEFMREEYADTRTSLGKALDKLCEDYHIVDLLSQVEIFMKLTTLPSIFFMIWFYSFLLKRKLMRR